MRNDLFEKRIMSLFLTTILAVLLIPVKAHAIPTPDMLVSLVNIVPLLTGTVVGVTGGAYYWVNKRLGPQAGPLLTGGVFALCIILILFGYIWNQNREADRIANITMYLRCDMAEHEASITRYRLKTRNALTLWQEFGNFKSIDMSEVPEKLHRQPDAILLSSDVRTLRYHSGIPAVKIDNQLYPFSYSRAMELPAVLQVSTVKDLYLTEFSYISTPPSYYKGDKSFFKKFDNIYIVKNIQLSDRYVVDGKRGLRPADVENKMIDWPVEKEQWIIDEKSIYFPGIAHLLTDRKVAELLDEDDVYILAPYTNYHRSRTNQERLYIPKLLRGIDPHRIMNIDMNLSTTTEQLAKISEKLDGKRFIVTGLTKHDWIYEGLDATFEIWENLNHDRERFRLIGFNTRLPEVAAIRYEAEIGKGVVESLRDPFWGLVGWLHKKTKISVGGIIFCAAVLLRLFFFPVGIREACSRLMRARIHQAAQAPERPPWSGSVSTLMRQLKVSSTWEYLGAAVMLILIFPAYKILSLPPNEFQDISFLWMKNLTQPDQLLSIFVGSLIFLKLHIGNASKKILMSLLMTLSFTLLLLYLPSSLLIYLTGVLAVTLCQDFMALKRTDTRFNRALLISE